MQCNKKHSNHLNITLHQDMSQWHFVHSHSACYDRHLKPIQNTTTTTTSRHHNHSSLTRPLTHWPGREDAQVVKPSPGAIDQHSTSESYKGHQVDLTYFNIYPAGEADLIRHLKQLSCMKEDAVCFHCEGDHGKCQVPACGEVVGEVEKHLFRRKIQFPFECLQQLP